MPYEDYRRMKEEPLKSKIREDFFQKYKYTQLGNIDFVIAKHITEKGSVSLFEEFENDDLKSLLWAEAKQGTSHDIYESFVQLILTIGKEKTFEKYLPPKFIGAFDAEKFAFINYHDIQSVFYQNDFNWNVTPSNHDTKEFRQLHSLCENLLKENSILFRYGTQSAELKEFIRLNFKTDKEASEKISVTKNNFTFVFQKWSENVKPTIKVDWERAKKAGIISADFFLADLLSENGESLKDSLYVVLKNTKYELAKQIDELGFETSMSVGFSDRQKAYKEFWSIYARPPKEEYWDYIIARRDLLVPQDIRERKGSFFTPQIWVQKSQEYLAEALGETWQDDYYIWDCCAGTGNLLNGLTNYDNVWASTLDKQDVDVMMDRIAGGWNMPENHVFQFDFLNDSFEGCGTREEGHGENGGKIPAELAEILRDEEKRKKLVIYINPPYAEAGNVRQLSGTGENKTNVAVAQKAYEKYLDKIGIAGRELFAQFFIRIYSEINGCILAEFSKLKHLQAPNFEDFRNCFQAKLLSLFVVPAKTFDNVKGNFPIGFFIWDTKKQEKFNSITSDVFDNDGNLCGTKNFVCYDESDKNIGKWVSDFKDESDEHIGFMSNGRNDFQNQKLVYFMNDKSQMPTPRGWWITKNNLIVMSIFVAVRQCIEATWLNDRDQFLYPNDGWKQDLQFQTDCLIYTLFHGQNRISSQAASASTASTSSAAATASTSSSLSINHWIPFTREQVGCKKTFRSKFMSEFLSGKWDTLGGTRVLNNGNDLFANGGVYDHSAAGGVAGVSPAEGVAENAERLERGGDFPRPVPLENLSAEAQSVYNAGLALWKYYHSMPDAAADASFYDIRKYFQGTNASGKMNASSDDARYTELITSLREKMKTLGAKIAGKVYEYGFLK